MAPDIQVEHYRLDTSIASNCNIVINMGPQDDNHTECSDWKNARTVTPSALAKRAPRPHNITFYSDETCDCYYTANSGYWAS